MTDGEPVQGQRPEAQPTTPSTTASHQYVGTPHAERYVIAADNLRRRQLKSALLHGTSRTWREQRRIWPSVAAGLIVVALIATGIAVIGAFRAEQEAQRERQQRAAPFDGVSAKPAERRPFTVDEQVAILRAARGVSCPTTSCRASHAHRSTSQG